MAKIVLAAIFLMHLIKRLFQFWRRTHNADLFLGYFKHDGILPVGASERARLPWFQRCQVCSLCTLTCEAVIHNTAPPAFEPKYLMLGPGRSAHESEIFLEEWIPCAACSACTVNCPNNVPIHAMANQIIEQRKNFLFHSVESGSSQPTTNG